MKTAIIHDRGVIHMMEQHETRVKVLIVDDMESFRDRFYNVLSSDEQIDIVGLAKNGYEAIVLAAVKKPHVILMDVRMETNIAGIEASSEILKMLPETKIIITTVVDDDEVIFRAYQTGVENYLLKKNSKPEDVLNAVYNAYRNNSSISPEIAEKIRKKIRAIPNYQENVLNTVSIISKLTPTEMEILLLLCDGLSRQEIAEVRNITFSTVKTHINNMLSKFGLSSSRELVQMLKANNIIEIMKQLNQSQPMNE